VTRRAVAFVFVVLLMAACVSVGGPSTLQGLPTSRLESTPPSPTPVSMPTETANSTAHPNHTSNTEQLKDKWRAPMFTLGLTFTSMESMLDIAQRLQAGEMEGIAAFAELFAVALIVDGADKTLDEFEPLREQVEYVAATQGYLDTVMSVLAPWIDRELTSAEVPSLLEEDFKTAN